MYSASPEQRAQLEATQHLETTVAEPNREERIRKIRQKGRLIYDLVELAKDSTAGRFRFSGRSARVLEGTDDDLGWEDEATSAVAELPYESDSPDMGATITAYRTGFDRGNFFTSKESGHYISVAEMKVGVIHTSVDGERTLLGAQTVLRVTLHPPAVYYSNGESPLQEVEPSSEGWAEAEALLADLQPHADELAGKTTTAAAVY